MKFVLTILALALVQIQSWWENGHMLVAQVAKLHLEKLNPVVLARATQLIDAMGDLGYDYDNTFVTSACWADDIKSKAMNFWDNWHFQNLPVNPNGVYITQTGIQKEINAVDAMKRAIDEFKNDDGSIDAQKTIFIRYIIHIAGDVHQPLHSSDFYNATFPNGDLGGNLQEITTYDGTKLNLHAFWDSGALGFQTDGNNMIQRPFNDTTVIYMEKWATNIMNEFKPESFNGEENNVVVSDWTQSSWKVARDFVYPETYNTNVLSKEYQDKAQKICRERVALGGYRLAAFLQYAFKDYKPDQNQVQQNSHIDTHDRIKVEKIAEKKQANFEMQQFVKNYLRGKKPEQ